MTGKNLICIPRVQSSAPKKNTVEWEIPGKVKVGFVLVHRAGYFVFMKIRVEKKHWWNRSWKTYTAKSHDPIEAVMNALDILERHGFYIDQNTIQFDEAIGVGFSEPRDIQGFRVARSSFEKKPQVVLLKFRPEELDARTEWLFWSSLIHTKEALVNLKNIFGVDDYNWSVYKKEALFETLLWQFGGSIAVLKEKLLTDEQIMDLTTHLLYFLEIIFPTYNYYEIIDIFSPYIVPQEKEPKKLKDELEGYFIERICKLFNFDHNNINNDLKQFISIKFPFGWMLGIDAFTTVKIEDIENANLAARQSFRQELVTAQEIFGRGESTEDIKEREKWERNLEEFNELLRGVVGSLEKEVERRNRQKKV